MVDVDQGIPRRKVLDILEKAIKRTGYATDANYNTQLIESQQAIMQALWYLIKKEDIKGM